MKVLKRLSQFDVITNIAYILVGLVLYTKSVGWWIPTTCVLLGIGSGILHYYKHRWSAYFDWGGMYAVFGGLAGFSWITNPAGATAIGMLLFLSALLIDIISHSKVRKPNLIAISAIMLIGIIVNFSLASALLVGWGFTIAFVPWAMAGGAYKTPNEHYELYHGFWHLLTSEAIYATVLILTKNLHHFM